MNANTARLVTIRVPALFLAVALAAGCGGGGGGGSGASVTGASQPPITVSGQVFAPGGTLASARIATGKAQATPVTNRALTVELVRVDGSFNESAPLATTTTNAGDGSYVITVPTGVQVPAPDVWVRVVANNVRMRSIVVAREGVGIRPASEAAVQRLISSLQQRSMSLSSVSINALAFFFFTVVNNTTSEEGAGDAASAIASVSQAITSKPETATALMGIAGLGGVTGRAMNASSGTPLVNFTARTDTNESVTVTGSRDGSFTIVGVATGNRTVTITAANFSGTTAPERQVLAGAITDYGNINLTPAVTNPPSPPAGF